MLPAAGGLLLAACSVEKSDERSVMVDHGDGNVTVRVSSPTWSVGVGADPVGAAKRAASSHGGGRLIDIAGVLGPEEKRRLEQRLAEQQQASGQRIMVLIIEPAGQASLEQVGWAVGSGRADEQPLMILVNPSTRQVRIEGGLSPEQRAAVAGAVRDGLTRETVAAGLARGLDKLGQVTS